VSIVVVKLNTRTLLAMLHDLAAAALAWSIAYLLRFNFEPPDNFIDEMVRTLLWVAPLQGVVFWRFGLYQGLWRYASVTDLRRIFLAVLTAAALIPLVLWMFRVSAVVPRSVLVINPILLLLIMGGSRFVYRLWKEQGLYRNIRLNGEPVLVLGAGDAAVSLSKELARSNDWRLVGFLDDDADKHGHALNGIKVLGMLDELPQWAERLNVTQAIIAMPSG
jgi:FlaA1/EpsC-like NDP-sugar epimerase